MGTELQVKGLLCHHHLEPLQGGIKCERAWSTVKSHTGKGDKGRGGGGTLEGQQKALELDREDVESPAPPASPSASCAPVTWCDLQTLPVDCRETKPKAWEGSLPTRYYLNTAIQPATQPPGPRQR